MRTTSGLLVILTTTALQHGAGRVVPDRVARDIGDGEVQDSRGELALRDGSGDWGDESEGGATTIAVTSNPVTLAAATELGGGGGGGNVSTTPAPGTVVEHAGAWVEANLLVAVVAGVIVMLLLVLYVRCCCCRGATRRKHLLLENDRFELVELEREQRSHDRENKRSARRDEVRDKYNLGYAKASSNSVA